MLTTNRGRVMAHRLRKKAGDFAKEWLSEEEYFTVKDFLEAMKEHDCNDSPYSNVTFKPEIIKRFRDYLGSPKRNEEVHYEELYIQWYNAKKGEQTA